ncbi:uncharacterized protein LOC122611824 [Drosophila teissieri]|uniref:uncharacterized protein LOC122611824 n=1 Tax=Drosophila teissieri TaxID=7243 RepID=UPI001CBA155F|nr:uncharacterized protein LOC122611824 [Drosophila teissieri]
MLQTPVNVAFFKRYSNYRRFMYNVTVDFCRFLKNPSSSPFVNFWYRIGVNHSNINHTCPYNHDLRIEKLPVEVVNYQVTEVLPLPEGDYLIKTTWLAYDIKKVEVQIFGTLF